MTTKIWGWFGPDEIELTPGVLDDAAREAFTCGQCHAMALALHEHTGWDLAGAEWEHYDGVEYPGHVFVVDPDGNPFDVNGYDVDERYVHDIAPVTEDELLYVFPSDGGYHEPDLDAGYHFAPLVLEHAGVSA